MDKSVITVRQVSKAVGNRRLLEEVSFSLEEASLVSLIGPNGAGKSTLVRIMLGLDNEYEGEVRVRAGERIQYIPQLPQNDQHQLPISVREYLAIGIYGSFQRSGAVDFEHALEHVGVPKEKLRQSFLTLSGGERQRVAIARALLANPTILVLDEPLAAVDYASRDGLYALIRHLQQDHHMTVMLVSHDVDSVLPLSDRVLCLNQRLHTDCHPAEFTAHGSSIATGVHHHC